MTACPCYCSRYSCGAKTLNGLLTEILQSIPDCPVGVELDGCYAEPVQDKDNMLRTVKMRQRATLPVPETS